VSDEPEWSGGTRYTGWALTPQSKAELLKRFPPIHSAIRCDHVTLDFDVKHGDLPIESTICLYGVLNLEGYQIAAVAVDGLLWQPRRDRMFHVTISRAEGLYSSGAGILLSQSVKAIQPVPRLNLATVPFNREINHG